MGPEICNADTAKKLHSHDEFEDGKDDIGRPQKKAIHARQNLGPALMEPVCTSTMFNEPLELKPEFRHIECGKTVKKRHCGHGLG
jgi:hypothetical protein